MESDDENSVIYRNNLDSDDDSIPEPCLQETDPFSSIATVSPSKLYIEQERQRDQQRIVERKFDRQEEQTAVKGTPGQHSATYRLPESRRETQRDNSGPHQEGSGRGSILRSNSPPTVADSGDLVCHPSQQNDGPYTATVYLANNRIYEYSMYGHAPASEFQVSTQETATSTQDPHCFSSGFWSQNFQDGARSNVVSFDTTAGRQPPMTAAFVSDQELREGRGRRPLRYDACPGCSQSLSRACVTQIPCHHMVCKQCRPRYAGDPCRVCGNAVERTALKDTAFL